MKEHIGLYLILTHPAVGYTAAAKAAVDCGVRYLQLRIKNETRETVLDTARRIRAITKDTNTLFIMNDDLDIAMECDADGIHVGQDDLSIETARKLWNSPGKIFGLSTHSVEQAKAAEALAPDYIGIGPTFSTPTKTEAGPGLGIQEVARIAASTTLTSVAIGGINAENLPGLLKAGIGNYCVVRAVNEASDPVSAIKHLQMLWKNHFCT